MIRITAIALIIVSALFPNITLAVSKNNCELLEALGKFDGTFYVNYKGKKISLVTDKEWITDELSKTYGFEIVSNKELLAQRLLEDADTCESKNLFKSRVKRKPSQIKSMDEVAMHVSGHARRIYQSEMINNLENIEDNLYQRLRKYGNKVFSPGLSSEDMTDLASINEEKYKISQLQIYVETSNSLQRLSNLISLYAMAQQDIENLQSKEVSLNDRKYIEYEKTKLQTYKSELMTSAVYISNGLGKNILPNLIHPFKDFNSKFEALLDKYNDIIKSKINDIEIAEKQERERIAALEAEKKMVKEEQYKQKIKERCTPILASIDFPIEMYDYILPGNTNISREIAFGEFVCLCEASGALSSYSSPGMFSDEHTVILEVNEKVTLNFIEVNTESNKESARNFTGKPGPFMMMSSASDSSGNRNFKGIIQQGQIIGPLIYLLRLEALQSRPELFQ